MEKNDPIGTVPVTFEGFCSKASAGELSFWHWGAVGVIKEPVDQDANSR